MGIAYLNINKQLCLSLLREGALEIRLQRGIPQGEQVRLQTASIEYDENIADCPKKEVSTLLGSVVGLTFVGIGSDDEEEYKEEVEGYSIVNVMSITETNAARI